MKIYNSYKYSKHNRKHSPLGSTSAAQVLQLKYIIFASLVLNYYEKMKCHKNKKLSIKIPLNC